MVIGLHYAAAPFQKTLERMLLQNWTSFLDSLHSIGGMRATMSARTHMNAGSDDTRAKRKQFGVFLCLPMALVLLPAEDLTDDLDGFSYGGRPAACYIGFGPPHRHAGDAGQSCCLLLGFNRLRRRRWPEVIGIQGPGRFFLPALLIPNAHDGGPPFWSMSAIMGAINPF